jgi:hypothetical protein
LADFFEERRSSNNSNGNIVIVSTNTNKKMMSLPLLGNHQKSETKQGMQKTEDTMMEFCYHYHCFFSSFAVLLPFLHFYSRRDTIKNKNNNLYELITPPMTTYLGQWIPKRGFNFKWIGKIPCKRQHPSPARHRRAISQHHKIQLVHSTS